MSPERRPSAAVFEQSDPRGAKVARVVPADAQRVGIGGAVLGYFHKPGRSQHSFNWSNVMAFQRYNEIARIVRYRRTHNLDSGPPIGWANVLSNLCACIGHEVSVSTVKDLCRRLNLPEIDADVVAGVARDTEKSRRVWADYELMNAASMGALLQVTAAEREECALVRIDAWDEPAADRKRRLARERKRRERAKKRQAG